MVRFHCKTLILFEVIQSEKIHYQNSKKQENQNTKNQKTDRRRPARGFRRRMHRLPTLQKKSMTSFPFFEIQN